MCPLCAFIEAERKAAYRTARKQKAKELGLCVMCMKAPPRPGKTLCMTCMLHEAERKSKAYWAKKEARAEAIQ